MKSLPLVRVLLDAGADPNAPNPLPNSYDHCQCTAAGRPSSDY
jgi:hypothetical protein